MENQEHDTHTHKEKTMNFLVKNELEMELSEIENKALVHLESTVETPEIILDKEEGKFRFAGRSLPENPKTFYAPIKSWLQAYIENPCATTHVTFMYDYFNTASSKVIMEILDLFKEVEKRNGKLIIDWYYHEDDDDMLEAGEDFESITDTVFNFHSFY